MDYTFNFAPVWRNFDHLLEGLGLGLLLAAGSIVIGTVLGGVLAFGLISRNGLLRRLCGVYVAILRNLPPLLVIFVTFFALPQFGIRLDKIQSFVTALSLYYAAYLAEVFRGGLIAVPKGLSEAGLAIGLRPLQIKLYIVVPVMLRAVVPTLGNTFISLFKDTSLASAIAVPELTFYARKINTESFRVIESWTVASLLYIGATFVLATALRLLERHLRIGR